MNEAITQDQFSRAVQEFKQGLLDEEALCLKFDGLLADNDFSTDQSLAELRDLVTTAELSEPLTDLLLDKLAEFKTRIVKTSPEIPASENEVSENNQNLNSSSHASSLLRNLMQWHEGDQQKVVKANQTIRDTYRLIEKIGKGGMGVVWKAVDLIQDAGDSKDKYVAIKFISHEIRSHPYALKALVREFARYKKLIHRNIVKAYEINRDESEVFIVMEFLDGVSLKEFIKQHPNGISLIEAKPIIGGMCKALNYAHKEGIIHLDFKPGNVFYNSQTRITKVIDFGIARLSKQSDRDKTRFDPGKLGAITTAYASIEMLMEADPDPRDDVYGLACVVYELLSGEHPFKRGLAVVAEREKLQPKPIKGLKPDEFKAILRGLSFDKKNRTPTAEQIFQELYLPGVSAKRQLIRRLITGSIITAALIITPIILSTGYDFWETNRITRAIHQQKISGINAFKTLTYEDQIELLKNDKTRIALVQFPIKSEGYQIDAIQFLQQFSTSIQKVLFKQRDVRALLIPHYIEKINYAMSTDDFASAENYARSIMATYPDSKSLTDLFETIKPGKLRRLNELERQYRDCFNQQAQSLLDLMPCLQETRNSLAKISAQHKLLEDPNLSARYTSEISTALANKKLTTAKNLLADWRVLIPTADKQREELNNRLMQSQDVAEINALVVAGSDGEMPELIVMLLSLDSSKSKKVLRTPAVKQKLLAYFTSEVNTDISSENYAAGLKHIDKAEQLFPDAPKEKKYLQQLTNKIKKHRSQRLVQLAKQYKAALNFKEPDIATLQDVQVNIQHIDPDNSLVQYPGVEKAFTQRIEAAISAEQFDLADRLLKNWITLKPKDREKDSFVRLTNKRNEHMQAWRNRMAYADRLQEALQSNQVTVMNSVLAELQNNLSRDDQRRVLSVHRKQLVVFYQLQIQNAIGADNFTTAETINAEALALFPKEQALLAGRQKIARAKNTRIGVLVANYQRALKTDPTSGKEIFSHLEQLRSIDNHYLEKHPKLFKNLKTRLLDLAKISQSLPQLQDVMRHWEKFINGAQNSKEAKEIYRKTKNLVALRCLYNGRQLKEQGNQKLGDELLMFGLSLDPINTVRVALENELLK